MKFYCLVLALFVGGCATPSSYDIKKKPDSVYKKILDDFEKQCLATETKSQGKGRYEHTYWASCKRAYTYKQMGSDYPFSFFGGGRTAFNKYLKNRYNPMDSVVKKNKKYLKRTVHFLRDASSQLTVVHSAGIDWSDYPNQGEDMNKASVTLTGTFWAKFPKLSRQNFYGGKDYVVDKNHPYYNAYLKGAKQEAAENRATYRRNEESMKEHRRRHNANKNKVYVDFNDRSNSVIADPNLNKSSTYSPSLSSPTPRGKKSKEMEKGVPVKTSSGKSLSCSKNVVGSGTYCMKVPEDISNCNNLRPPVSISGHCPGDKVLQVTGSSCERGAGTKIIYKYVCRDGKKDDGISSDKTQ